jgi:hypothetical protein
MKYGFCNLSNLKVTIQKKRCYGLIIYNGIKDFEHAIVSRVITIRNKKFKKYEECCELYNTLLCVIKVQFVFKVHHISKRMFFMTNTK